MPKTKANAHFVDCDKATGDGGSWSSIGTRFGGPYPTLHELDASEIPEKPDAPSVADGATPVSNPAELQAMNGANSYILTSDIDLSGTSWTPISNFSGTLDGDGHTISNLILSGTYYIKNFFGTSTYVKTATDTIVFSSNHSFSTGDAVVYRAFVSSANPLVSETTYYIIKVDSKTVKLATSEANAIAGTQIDITTTGSGLMYLIKGSLYLGMFESIIDGAKIKNLTLDNFNVTMSSTNIDVSAGSLAGYVHENNGDSIVILNCAVTNSTVNMELNGHRAGGLLGYVHADDAGGDIKIYNCYASGVTTNAGGGLIGKFFQDSDNNNASSVVECYTTGCTITNPSAKSGGLVGEFVAGDAEDYSRWPVMHTCWSDATIDSTSGVDQAGGLIGLAEGCIITNCYATGDISCDGNMYACGGFIGNIGGLNSGTHEIINCYATGNLSSGGATYIVAGFCGKYDSDGHCIRCYSTGNISSEGATTEVGGFIGFFAGSELTIVPALSSYGVERCWSTGDITVSDPSQGAFGIGGFVGGIWKGNDSNPDPAIRNCYAWGSIISTNGWVVGGQPCGVGGFVGAVDDYGGGLDEDFYVENCYCAQTNTRSGSGLSDQITYESGVSGGFLGNDGDLTEFDFITTNCFFDKDTCGFSDDASTATGLDTSSMQTKSTYEDAGWVFSSADGVKDDIDSIWTISEPKAGTSTQSRTVAYPQDYAHLEGQEVQVLADGIYLDDETYTVSGGEVTPEYTATVDHVGLKITSKLQPMKVDGEVNVKRISKLVVDVNNSVGGEYGERLDKMYTMELRSSGDPMDRDGTLHTGHIDLPFNGRYDRQGDIWITQDIPLPLTVLGMGIYLSKENK